MLYIRHDATNTLSFNLDKDRGSSTTNYNIRIWNDVEGNFNDNSVSFNFTASKTARRATFTLTEPADVDLKGVKGSFSYRISNSVGDIVDRGKIRAFTGNLSATTFGSSEKLEGQSKIYGYTDSNYISPDDDTTTTQFLNI